MKRNLLILAFFVVSLILVVNSTKRLLTFKTTAQRGEETQMRLSKLKEENETLRRELDYKKSQEFVEREIRNKLGLAKEGEVVVVLPREQDGDQLPETRKKQRPNYKKWWNLFFGG